jgi:hypothetical protein
MNNQQHIRNGVRVPVIGHRIFISSCDRICLFYTFSSPTTVFLAAVSGFSTSTRAAYGSIFAVRQLHATTGEQQPRLFRRRGARRVARRLELRGVAAASAVVITILRQLPLEPGGRRITKGEGKGEAPLVHRLRRKVQAAW